MHMHLLHSFCQCVSLSLLGALFKYFCLIALLSCSEMVPRMDVAPATRLQAIQQQVAPLRAHPLGPCDGYSTVFHCMCNYHGLAFLEEVAWVSLSALFPCREKHPHMTLLFSGYRQHLPVARL